jgi:hypothetical protein
MKHLPQDYDTPAAPPDDVSHKVPLDHPIFDTDIDSDELYNLGLDEAADMRSEHEQSELQKTDRREVHIHDPSEETKSSKAM